MFVYQVSVILGLIGIIFVPGSRSKDIAQNDDGLYFENVREPREDLQALELNSGQDVKKGLFEQYLQDQMNALYRKRESIRQVYEKLKDSRQQGLQRRTSKHDFSRRKAWQRHELADNFESNGPPVPGLHRRHELADNFESNGPPVPGLHKDTRTNQIILEREKTFSQRKMFDGIKPTVKKTGPPGLHKDMKNGRYYKDFKDVRPTVPGLHKDLKYSRYDTGIEQNSRFYEDFKDDGSTAITGPPGLHKDMKNGRYYKDFKDVRPTVPGLHKDLKYSRYDTGIEQNSRFFEDLRDVKLTTTPKPGPPGLHKDMKNGRYYKDFKDVRPTVPGLHKDMKYSRYDTSIEQNSRYFENFKDDGSTAITGPPGLHKDMKNSRYYEDFKNVRPTVPGLHKK